MDTDTRKLSNMVTARFGDGCGVTSWRTLGKFNRGAQLQPFPYIQTKSFL